MVNLEFGMGEATCGGSLSVEFEFEWGVRLRLRLRGGAGADHDRDGHATWAINALMVVWIKRSLSSYLT